MSTLFERLQRYQRTAGRDAREDRLTEALAVTLEAAPGAARHVVRKHFDVCVPSDPRVATQVHRPGVGRVDLELCFDHPAQRALIIWLEAKVDSRAFRAQGEKYMRELGRRPSESWRFAWLMRGDHDVEGDVPDGAKRLTWQELGSSLREWLGGQGGSREDYGRTLVSEFLDHLEGEERLAFTQRLAADDAGALDAYAVAVGRLRELLDQTKALLEQEWGRRDPAGGESWRRRSSQKLPDFYLALRRGRRNVESSWPKSCYFEWHGRRDDAREQPHGLWVIGAGVTFPAAAAPDEAKFREWFDELRGAGFEHGSGWRNEYEHVFKYLTLAKLAEECDGRDVGVQAKQLADWVIRVLDELNRLGPPQPDARKRSAPTPDGPAD